MLSESEASELFGDYIDEDTQTVQQASLHTTVPNSIGCAGYPCTAIADNSDC